MEGKRKNELKHKVGNVEIKENVTFYINKLDSRGIKGRIFDEVLAL